ALVRVAGLDTAGRRRIQSPAESEVARNVFALGANGHDVHRLLESLDAHGSALDVVQPLDLAREMRHTRAHEHLAWPREGAEPGREVERPAAVAAVNGYRLARVESDADSKREAGIGDRFRHEPLLQVGRRSQRLPRRIEHRERLVA